MKTDYTKREMYELIKALVDAGVISGELTETGITEADVAQFCVDELELLDKKVAKAKERVAAKKAEADELLDAVRDALSADEFQSIPDITARIDGEEVTVARVTARLKKLLDAGEVEKDQITVPGADGKKSRKIVAYRYVVNA